VSGSGKHQASGHHQASGSGKHQASGKHPASGKGPAHSGKGPVGSGKHPTKPPHPTKAGAKGRPTPAPKAGGKGAQGKGGIKAQGGVNKDKKKGGGGLGQAVSVPGIVGAGGSFGLGGGSSSSSSSSSQQSSSSSQTQEIQSGPDSFGFGSLGQVLGDAGRKKRELPDPAHGSSSSLIDVLVRKKRMAAKQ